MSAGQILDRTRRKLEELAKQLDSDPAALSRAARATQQSAIQTADVQRTIDAIRNRLARRWTGTAFGSFSDRATRLTQSIGTIREGLDGRARALTNAAKALRDAKAAMQRVVATFARQATRIRAMEQRNPEQAQALAEQLERTVVRDAETVLTEADGQLGQVATDLRAAAARVA